MRFGYEEIFRKLGTPENNIQDFKKYTGYGKVFSNYKKSQKYIKNNDENIFFITLITYFKTLNYLNNNGYFIWQHQIFPHSFYESLKDLNGKIIINTDWILNCCIKYGLNPNKFIKIPYLQDFQTLNSYKKSDFLELSTKFKDYIKFYNISDYKVIKNIPNLIQSFIQQFRNNQKVLLVIKTNYMMDKNEIKVCCLNPLIILVNKFLQQQTLINLHRNCDVYVSPAMGVGWEIPPFQALYFGNILCCGNHTGFNQWVDFDVSIKLQNYKTHIKLLQCDRPKFTPLYLDQNQKKYQKLNLWPVYNIQISQLRKKLRLIYDNHKQLKKLHQEKIDLSKYDIKNINFYLSSN